MKLIDFPGQQDRHSNDREYCNPMIMGEPKKVNLCIHNKIIMVTKTINIRESAYHALKAHKRAGESYSDVILRVTGGEERSVCDFLDVVDPAIRSEIAESVKAAKSKLDRARPRKVSL